MMETSGAVQAAMYWVRALDLFQAGGQKERRKPAVCPHRTGPAGRDAKLEQCASWEEDLLKRVLHVRVTAFKISAVPLPRITVFCWPRCGGQR